MTIRMEKLTYAFDDMSFVDLDAKLGEAISPIMSIEEMPSIECVFFFFFFLYYIILMSQKLIFIAHMRMM